MDGYAAYQYSMAIKMHFTGAYDAVKYRYKTRVSQKSYWGRPDKYQLTKIGAKFNNENDIVQYFVAHNLNGTKWVGDMIRDEDVYKDHIKRLESLTYNFKNEIAELSDYTLDGLISQYKSNYPKIIDKYLEGDVSLETITILNALTGFADNANKNITETILWPDLYMKITKYQPFLKFDKDKFTRIILSNWG